MPAKDYFKLGGLCYLQVDKTIYISIIILIVFLIFNLLVPKNHWDIRDEIFYSETAKELEMIEQMVKKPFEEYSKEENELLNFILKTVGYNRKVGVDINDIKRATLSFYQKKFFIIKRREE
jgi:hypothetical protein